jgi:serine phosphatase RsbU (regulator of sigma subunit)/integral membrane sensor domain MASE1
LVPSSASGIESSVARETPSDSAVAPLWRVGVYVVAAYLLGSWISYEFLHASSAGAVMFPPAGVSFAALALTNKRQWPFLLLLVGTANLVIDLAQGQRVELALGFAVANTIEPLLGATLFRRHLNVRVQRRRDLLGFIATGVLAGPFAGALIGATTIAIGFNQRWIGAFFPFWSGDGLGALTVGGAVLAWTARPPNHRTTTITNILLVIGATAGLTVIGFWPSSVPLVYLPMPLLFFLALRSGAPLLTIAGLSTALTANLMSAAGHGPWGAVGPTARLGISTLQLFLVVALVAGWLLYVEVAEQQLARREANTESLARFRAEWLQKLSANLAIATTSEAICRAVIEHGISPVADRGVVGVVSVDGRELITFASKDFPGDLAAKYRRLPLASVTQITSAARLGRIEVARNRDDLQRNFPETLHSYLATNTYSSISVPARSGDRVVGALAFGYDSEDRCDEAVGAAQLVGDLFGQALDRAQHYEREHETALELQRSLLPVVPATMGAVAIATLYQPAELRSEVGGDWYDVFPLPHGRIGFAVGDVVGHDLQAAIAMFRVQMALRVIAADATGPTAVLEQLSAMTGSIPGAIMTTVGYGDYDPITRNMRYACAGHVPFLLRTDSTDYLWGGRSAPLGIDVGPRPESELTVPPGSVLVGFTDGLIERRAETIHDGLRRLADTIRHMNITNLDDLCESLLLAMAVSEAQDDTAILCLRFD